LAENAVRAEESAMHDLRHKLASEYYYSKLIDPLIPGNKKSLLSIEYLYHLAKQDLSTIQIISVAKDLSDMARGKETPSDIHQYKAKFLNYLIHDSEIKEVLGRDLYNDIVTTTQEDLAA
jgi:hypothetical protein